MDGVFFTGQAERPVYLLVTDGAATLQDASGLWGLSTSAAERKLRERHGEKAQAAVIGPAGERRSAMAAVINDGGRAAARSGLGMVMGAKRLKAVVAVGRQAVSVAEPEGLGPRT